MSAQSVPLKPQPKKVSRPATKTTAKRLTLAHITVVRREGDTEFTRTTGPELARLIQGTTPEEGRPPVVSREAICEELDCLAELVQVLSVADHDDCDFPLDKSLYWVGESLKRLSTRVLALEQAGNAAPSYYAVEVTK